MEDKWGYGNPENTKPFDKVNINGMGECDLLHGEHPHSRQDNTTYAKDKSGHIVGFDGHRLPLEIHIKEGNYLKDSHYSGSQVRKSCSLSISINGQQIYEEGYRTWERAVIGVQRYVDKMEIYWNLIKKEEQEKLIGTTVGYKEQLFKVSSFVGSQSCVMLAPIGEKRSLFLFETGEDAPDEYELKESIKVEYWHVNWYVK